MALTILERPKGYVLDDPIDAHINEAPGFPGQAIVDTVAAHGLSTGDIVYIQSNIEDYNGFVYVELADSDEFLIKDITGTDYIDYFQDSDCTYQVSQLTHGFSCVHLPITYKISNNLYPTNTADTTRNINSVQDANGYTVILLSGSLGSGVNSYDFVKLTLPNDTDLSGVYQIVEFISPTVMIVNLEYDSGNNFTSATALKHYNNYNVIVRVYAGINASHQWTSVKPYELAATLELTPDEDNEVFFSINELLKSYIETRNNLVLATLPNNIDFWANFYIELAESYDDSDGYTFGTSTSSFTSDQSTFEGTAVNAKLEFKNIHSGSLSEYLMTNNTAKFLTLFTIPVLFQCGDDTPDCYSDISFLNPYDGVSLIIRKEFYSNGNGPVIVDVTISVDSGVIRTELEADCTYDRVDVTIIISPPDVEPLADWLQTATSAVNWTLGSNPSVTLDPTSTNQSEQLYSDFAAANNIEYTFNYDIDADNGFNVLTIGFLNAAGSTLTSTSENLFGVSNIGQISLSNISGIVDRVFIQLSTLGAVGPIRTLDVNSFDLDSGDQTISETKTFTIDCDCINHEIRLTWLNNLGGFDYWAFTAKKDHLVEIQEAMMTKKNILPNWPKSYGADADTIKKQTKRISNKAYTVRSQFLTEDEADAISYIKSSLLVQIVNSRTDRRTVKVDTDSFVKRKDGDNTFEIAFNISFTDDIPVQTL